MTAGHFPQTCASINECACQVNTSFPVIIHFRSRSNQPTMRGLAQSSFDPLTIHFCTTWIKWGHDWSRFSRHQSSLKHECGQAFSCVNWLHFRHIPLPKAMHISMLTLSRLTLKLKVQTGRGTKQLVCNEKFKPGGAPGSYNAGGNTGYRVQRNGQREQSLGVRKPISLFKVSKKSHHHSLPTLNTPHMLFSRCKILFMCRVFMVQGNHNIFSQWKFHDLQYLKYGNKEWMKVQNITLLRKHDVQ